MRTRKHPVPSLVVLLLVASLAAYTSGCETLTRPPLYANLGADRFEKNADELFDVGMPKSRFERVLSRLPAEPAAVMWVSTPENPGPFPMPRAFVDHSYMRRRGILPVDVAPGDGQLSDLDTEHFALADWYKKRDSRLWGVEEIHADWSAALTTAFFDSEHKLVRLRIGPTMGWSGRIYRPEYTLSN